MGENSQEKFNEPLRRSVNNLLLRQGSVTISPAHSRRQSFTFWLPTLIQSAPMLGLLWSSCHWLEVPVHAPSSSLPSPGCSSSPVMYFRILDLDGSPIVPAVTGWCSRVWLHYNAMNGTRGSTASASFSRSQLTGDSLQHLPMVLRCLCIAPLRWQPRFDPGQLMISATPMAMSTTHGGSSPPSPTSPVVRTVESVAATQLTPWITTRVWRCGTAIAVASKTSSWPTSQGCVSPS